MLERIEFINAVSDQIDIPLNKDQKDALASIYDFLFHGGGRSTFILRGYAGTGKTTLIGALIRWLHSVNRKTVLLAPTGRSAKVLAAHSGYPASTIHRRIYAVKQDDFGRMSVQLTLNKSEKTIFIADEASMIGDGTGDEKGIGRSLIQDLLDYVYSGERCRLILIGDDAQLPPVGLDMSPALDEKKLEKLLNGNVYHSVLRQVVRQDEGSLILSNATLIRDKISKADYAEMKLQVDSRLGFHAIESFDLEDEFSNAFSSQNSDDSVIICRSNKDAFKFNQQIRARILDRESELEAGDRLMIVKNNYHWKIPGRQQNFLANGDMIVVERVHGISTFGSFRFAECDVLLLDEDVPPFTLILLLNSIDFEGPSIPTKELFKLRQMMIDSGDVDASDPEERFYQNPYFNCAQIKYAYAITCHKSQGGQWKYVYVHQGYLTEEMLDRSYFRWLYTALTRATEKIGLVGFHPYFLEDFQE